MNFGDKIVQSERAVERVVAIDHVLEVIDSYKYNLCWSISEKLWDENLDKIKSEILELKGM